MTHWLYPDAETELGDAAAYYASRANHVIAEAFLAEYERVRDLIVENPQRGPHLEDGLRVYRFSRFPYSLVYGEDPGRASLIYAVAHQSRESGYWGSRI